MTDGVERVLPGEARDAHVQTLANGMQVFRSSRLCVVDATLSHLSAKQSRQLAGVMLLVAGVLLGVAQPGAAYNNGGTATWTSTFWGFWFLALVVLALMIGHWRRSMQVQYMQGGGAMQDARKRVTAWAMRHPEWSLRLYETPWALRVVATQAAMTPADAAVAQLVAGIKTAPFWLEQCRRNGEFAVVVRLDDFDAKVVPPNQFLGTLGKAEIHADVRAALQCHDAALGLTCRESTSQERHAS